MLFPPYSWGRAERTEGAAPQEERSEGPMPGHRRRDMKQGAEFQRGVEMGMMERVVGENEKLNEELRGLRESRGRIYGGSKGLRARRTGPNRG